MKKLLSFDFLLLGIPFILWVICFRYFLNGHLPLEADAISYADHIGFYTNNLSHGIYPLWNPTWDNGVPYDFFLRRMGDVNPLLLMIVMLKWIGVSSAASYMIFLGVYYFLAGWAFYLITRFLLADRFFAFTAYILFIFSSWGCEIFFNYIIIILVPIIWFFYFLLCFSREAKKGFFLGMCMCVGIILTTYIPFFFLTILALFTFFYILLYGGAFLGFLNRGFIFISKNKVFALFCAVFLLVSCIPGLIFYKESKSNTFVMPGRHSGSSTSSEVTVGLDNVASGDIISHGDFDHIFDDQINTDMGDIFIPYAFFLILLCAACGRVNKLIFFLLFNILAVTLITITSAGGVHRFLYEHLVVFKFIRNIYYFFWLAILPMSILLSVSAFKSLLQAIDDSSKKTAWLIYIIGCHLLFVLFLLGHQGVLAGAWAATAISLVYFTVYIRCDKKISYPAGFYLLFMAVFFQSAQLYVSLENKLLEPQQGGGHAVVTSLSPTNKLELYYDSPWFAVLVNFLDPQVLDNYRERQCILYDNVFPYEDSPEFFKAFQTSISSNENVAYVPRSESTAADWKKDPDAAPQADAAPAVSGEVKVLSSDANTFRIRTHLPDSRFLVINDNYDKDWHAFINGRPARLLRANVAFKGIWVPAGDATVVLRFSSPKWYVFHFSLIAFFAGTFLYLLALLRRSGSYE